LKELLLLRHAKSDWGDPEQDDFDRPLAKRGRRAASAIGGWLARHGWRPDLVLCSSSKRTRETWALVAEALGGAPTVRFERRLYLAESETLARRVARLDDGIRRAMVIGHNPGIGRYAVGLAPAGGATARRMRAKFPTGAAAWFALDGKSWRDGALGPARLLAYVTPADLADG
jgi:phosphohistidine phosphatase